MHRISPYRYKVNDLPDLADLEQRLSDDEVFLEELVIPDVDPLADHVIPSGIKSADHMTPTTPGELLLPGVLSDPTLNCRVTGCGVLMTDAATQTVQFSGEPGAADKVKRSAAIAFKNWAK